MVVLLADIQLAPDNRFHAILVRCIHEVHGAEYVAMVGHRHSRHAYLAYMLAKFFNVTGAIQQGIIGVQMKVDELGHGSRLVYLNADSGKVWTAVRFEG